MDYKALLRLVALAITTALLTCSPSGVSAQIAFGSVTLINAVGEKVFMPQCSGPDGDHHGPVYINSPGSHYFRFQANSISQGWHCKFEYVNTAEGNRKYTADVHVWQGLFNGNRAADAQDELASLVFEVPCMDCIWKIQRDGFYRADDTNHAIFRLLARWV